MNLIKRNVTVLLLLIFLITQMAFAHEITEIISLGQTLKMKSNVLSEERNIFIYLPEGYEESNQQYPVLFLLDGAVHFHHGTGIVQFLSANGLMPRLIVVAIPNTDRNRDFSPTVENGQVNSGGADHFLDFLQHELIPLIDAKYRTNPYRILFGHSLTGMFSVYTFITRPQLFSAYIAASPYLQYAENLVVKEAEEILSAQSVKGKVLYLTLGDEPAYMESIGKFTKILKKINAPGLYWKYDLMKQENHATVPHKTIYQGLEFIFSGWQIPAEKALNLASIQNHYQALTNRFGIEVKPSEVLLNRFGYQILAKEEFVRAIEVFKANVKIYPNSNNVYDSLGEAYERSGNLEQAIKNYKIAVEKGEKAKSRNLAIYKTNLERVQRLLK